MKPILIPVDQPLTMELLQEVADKCYQAGYEDGKNASIVIPEWGKSNEPYKITPYYTGDMPFTYCDSKTSDTSIRVTN